LGAGGLNRTGPAIIVRRLFQPGQRLRDADWARPLSRMMSMPKIKMKNPVVELKNKLILPHLDIDLK
jgi:hypothetical protein